MMKKIVIRNQERSAYGYSRRQLRGLGIVARGGQVSAAGRKDAYYVRSQSSDHAYKVQKYSDNKWSCDCPDFVKNSKACKHVFAVQYWLRLPRIANSNGWIIFEKDMTKNGTCT